MATMMTLGEFYRYLREKRKLIADIYREVEEVQYQFNDLHTRQRQEHQKLVATYAPLLAEPGEDLAPELKQLLDAQVQVERQALQDEMARLEAETAAKRQQADSFVSEAQRQVTYLRDQNPILNQQEEELKARRTSLEADIERLKLQIRQLGGLPIGWLVNLFKRQRLRRELADAEENLQAVLRGIRAVREKWQEEKNRLQASQVELQGKWQALSVETAQLQARLDFVASNLDQESQRNAARNLLNNMIESPVVQGTWAERLTPLAELLRAQKNYETGLTAVAEILGLLTGLGEGMDRFIRSVATVYEEQRRYKLPQLTLTLSDAATALHSLWPDLQSKVKDEKYLGANPLEFSQRVQEFATSRLHEPAIQKMFDDMGEALTAATKAWR